MPRVIRLLAVVLLSMATLAVVAWAIALWIKSGDALDSSSNDALQLTVAHTSDALVRGDRNALQRLATDAAWKCLHKTYDFALGALRFKGSFEEYLQTCGKITQEAQGTDVVRTDLQLDLVMFVFKGEAESLSVAFRCENGRWRVAFLALGEIDRGFVRSEVTK